MESPRTRDHRSPRQPPLTEIYQEDPAPAFASRVRASPFAAEEHKQGLTCTDSLAPQAAPFGSGALDFWFKRQNPKTL